MGSNVYAFELLQALEEKTRDNPTIAVTVLLSSPAKSFLPVERQGWKYQLVGSQKFWTQWALPLHLFAKRKPYDIFFTPGHYAPRIASIPYVSSVMDTAYLDYPEQFTPRDRVQLTDWTEYSVKRAKKIIVISTYTKQSVLDHYSKSDRDVIIAYPAIKPLTTELSTKETEQFFARHQIRQPYILFVGTLQPRKNLVRLISAYDELRKSLESNPPDSKKRSKERLLTEFPQLVLAGKQGWMAAPILERIKQSPYKNDIITTGFISDLEKKALYSRANSLVLIGLHEGFGIPPLEAMQYGTIPIVANTTSLPEVVGTAGMTVDPTDEEAIRTALLNCLYLTAKERANYLRAGREQIKKFSWSKTADVVLRTLLTIVDQTYHG